ncbi:putative secreted protein [Wickerhamomyces ciferrii]|uniref:Peptide hydrolase n=1 Tax=Wickerhamomyces ciferrii (strain ATCC 14091 / BCRC 22168 / CBS 111 / JCM 3599 / NBRC 0793 / NRRL Y-1031 F-60-10) TaxID=1206466 RepID=K0KYW0_WICCF|nr:uncharacterized protein BN7_5850 [Wickerhamomyces ciferrii]CCH46258.1 putative secreted protein [Wickerhamomyces ciferrii]
MKLSLLSLSLALAPATLAAPLWSLEGLQSLVPNFANEERLIVTSEDSAPIKVTEDHKMKLRRSGVKFMDITNHQSWFAATSKEKVPVPVYNYPTNVSYPKEVSNLITDIKLENLHDNLANFSSFYSRYYKSENGFKSATWLFTKLQEITSLTENNITVEKFKHEWQQFSIIVRIPGSKTPENRVVVGAHQDSTNLLFPTLMKAPGADDDGSGVTTNLEALRILVESGFQPENTVEFHFFSAEEGGLLGSLDIFTDYKSKGHKVVSVLQQDMTGYIQKTLDNDVKEHVGVITDYVSAPFTDFIKLVIDSYLSIPYIETKCGYACSDHASALQNGYPSSFVIESDFQYTNPYIHSTSDTLDRLSFHHIAEFTKLVLGYTYELGFHEFEEVK